MSTVETITSPVTGAVTESEFDQTMRAYGADGKGTKFTRLVDAVAAICDDCTDERELGGVIGRVQSLITNLDNLVQHGEGYTPPKSAGFGSDNAATIAEKLLGIGQSAGETRKAAKDWGKNVR
jgi:hypothetical protein